MRRALPLVLLLLIANNSWLMFMISFGQIQKTMHFKLWDDSKVNGNALIPMLYDFQL